MSCVDSWHRLFFVKQELSSNEYDPFTVVVGLAFYIWRGHVAIGNRGQLSSKRQISFRYIMVPYLTRKEYNETTRKYLRKGISLIYIFELMHDGQKLLCVFHLKFLLLCVQSLYRKRTSRPLVRMHDLFCHIATSLSLPSDVLCLNSTVYNLLSHMSAHFIMWSA